MMDIKKSDMAFAGMVVFAIATLLTQNPLALIGAISCLFGMFLLRRMESG